MHSWPRCARIGAVTASSAALRHYTPDPFLQTLAVVEGPLGSIELLEGYRMRLHRNGRIEETDVEPDVPVWGSKPWHLVQESVIAFQRHAIAVIEGRATAQPSGIDNLRTLAVTLAAIRSAKSGHAVAPEATA